MFMTRKLGPAIQQAAKSLASRATTAPQREEAAKFAASRAVNPPASDAGGFKAMSSIAPKIAMAAAKSLSGRRMKTGGKAKKINY